MGGEGTHGALAAVRVFRVAVALAWPRCSLVFPTVRQFQPLASVNSLPHRVGEILTYSRLASPCLDA